MKLVIVDDDSMICEALQIILEANPNIEISAIREKWNRSHFIV